MDVISRARHSAHHGRLARYRRQAGMAWRYLGYGLKLPRPWAYPHRMYIESTNACNLRCIMCPTGRGLSVRPKGYMEWDLFRQIIDEMAPHVSATTLHIWGEPLLHPRIVDMIAYCHDHGLHAELSTNAVLLTPELSAEIIQAGLGAIYLCMDGTNPETYEYVRREATYAETEANIRRFLELRAERDDARPETKLQIIEIEPTREQIASFREMWSVPGVDKINVKAFDSWGDQVDDISSLRVAEVPDVPPRYPCPNLWYHAHIYWDGTLVCCDRDFDARYPLGHVGEGVMKTWRGEAMARLRLKHVNRDLDDVPSCSGCREWAWWRPTWTTAQGNAPLEQG